ncbi:SH3 domain-containing protein [Bacillus sp. P14.5]|uniref:SH3 domain-containing protein n=1 Tax=Bacillus sp. P14.5 TaxID=1983400 RepID=UPI0013B061E8|nr:SH3 domain-containing protein [Bacillus sp. P14.5]
MSSLPVFNAGKAVAEGEGIIINTESLNVRNGPGLSFSVAKQVHKGDKFPIVSRERDWYEIQLTASQTGWVANWLVTLSKSSDDRKGIVSEDGLRIRQGAGTNHPVVATLQKGQEITITGDNGNWFEISAGQNSGWVHKDYITGDDPPLEDREGTSTIQNENWTGVSTDNSLNVRNSPGLNGSVLGKLNKGDKVPVTGSVSGWFRIGFGNTEGWVSSQYIEKPSSASKPPANQAAFGKVTIHTLNIREKADLNGEVIGSVKHGEVFEILEEESNWYKLSLKGGKTGWAAGWYIEKTVGEKPEKQQSRIETGEVQILYNGTNLRSSASTNSAIVARVSSGETFPIKKKSGEWYEVSLSNGQSGFVAGWIVSVSGSRSQEAANKPKSGGLKGKTILIDPGHGGRDSGTIGYRGTFEKELTLSTSQILYDLLKNAGANVILTRNDDSYSSLNTRVALAHYHDSDAFISIHYDSISDSSVKGYTAYYYHQYQKELSQTVLDSLAKSLSSRNRGLKQGDYYVIRENKQPAVLLELGYLSNPSEEALSSTHSFQDMAARSIYYGLDDYFSE